MKLFYFEWKKVFGQKSFLILLFLCVFLNFFLLNFAVKDTLYSYKPEAYRKMEEELQNLSQKEAHKQLKSRIAKLKELQIGTPEQKEVEEACIYTENLWTEADLSRDVLQELESVMNYDSYLSEIQKDAHKRMGISIFQKNTGYSLRNLEKTAADFKKMEGLVLSFEPSKGVVAATGFLATDLIGVIMLFAVCMFLIVMEKQNGQMASVFCTARGRRETGLAKIGVLFTSSFLAVFLLYVENMIFAQSTYGFGDWNRPIQSVFEYRSCILQISVGEYFLLFFIVKILVYFLIALVLFTICLYFGQLLFLFSACLGVIGFEAAAWFFIPVNSVFSSLRYLNLFYFLQTDRLLTRYQNVNFLSYPVGIFMASGVIFFLIPVICIVAVMIQMNTNKILHSSRRIRTEILTFAKNKTGSGFVNIEKLRLRGHLIQFEYLKNVKKSGGLCLMLLVILLQYYRFQTYSYFQFPDQMYYRTYMNYLSGPVTEKTDSYIKEENERYALLQSKAAEYQGKSSITSESQDIMEQLVPYKAWEMVNAEYERVVFENQMLFEKKEGSELIRETNRRMEGERFLVYGDGYSQLSGGNQEMDITAAFLVSLLLILFISGIFSYDSTFGMERVIAASSLGRGDTLRAKKLLAFSLAFFSFIVIYGTDFLKVWMKIGMNQFTAPVQSLYFLSGCSFPLRLYQYLLLLYVLRFLGVCLISYGILAVSKLCGNMVRSMLTAMVIFLLPTILGMFHIEAVKKVTLLPLLIGNELLNSLLSGEVRVYMIGVILLGIIIFLGSELVLRKGGH